MKRTIKAAAALLMALMMLLALAGCKSETPSDVKETEEIPGTALVAKVGKREITRSDLLGEYNSMMQIYSYYGMETPTEDADIEEAQDTILDGLVSNQILLNQAELMGISPLAEDEAAEIQAQYDDEITSLWERFVSQAEADGAEKPEETAVELINEALETQGWSMDYEGYKTWLLDTMTEERILENLEEKVKEGVTAGADKAKTYYEDLVAAQTEQYQASPSDYLSERENYEMFGGSPVLVTPEGYVRIKVVSLAPEGDVDSSVAEKQASMTKLEAEYGKLSLENSASNRTRMAEIQKEYNTLSKEVKSLTTEFLKETRVKAEEALSKLASGTPFDDLIKEYGDDEAYSTYKTIGEKGRLMELNSNDDGWAKEIHDVVKTLPDGGFSGIIEADGALYIVERVGTEAAGTIAFDEVSDEVSVLASDEEKESVWADQQEAWTKDRTDVTLYDENYRDIGK